LLRGYQGDAPFGGKAGQLPLARLELGDDLFGGEFRGRRQGSFGRMQKSPMATRQGRYRQNQDDPPDFHKIC
jgi:hypothetical protein